MAVRFEKLRIWAILNNTCGYEQFLNKAQAEIPLAQRALIISWLSKYLWVLQAVQTLFASRQRTTLAKLLLGCRHLLQAEVEEWDISGTEYLQGSCFVFTNTIYQIPPWQSLAEFQMRWLCWHFNTGNLKDAVLSHLDQFCNVSSLDTVLLSVPVPLFLDFLILCFQPAACPPVL